MERLNKIHINYKDWEKVVERAKAIGIKTLAELEMYCRVWNIETGTELLVRLGSEYIEVLLQRNKEICERG